MLTDDQVVASVCAAGVNRAAFAQVFLQAQIGRPAQARTALDALSPAAADPEAFVAALGLARVQGFREALIGALVQEELEDGRLGKAFWQRGADAGNPVLQAMVSVAAGFGQPHVMMRGLAGALRWTAKVLVDGEFRGTGFLVGPNFLLTAWHVVSPLFTAAANGKSYEPVAGAAQRLRFTFDDYLLQTGTGAVLQSRSPIEVQAAASWCHRFSVANGDELQGRLPTDLRQLDGLWDYALLRLAGSPGFGRRWAALSDRAVVPSPGGKTIVMQYPLDSPMLMAEATIIDPVKYGVEKQFSARFLHGANSKSGSSGGPCFDKSFSLFGFHQGVWQRGANQDTLTINRGVPIARVMAELGRLPDPDPQDVPVWKLDAAGGHAPVLGRGDFQMLVWRMAAPSSVRRILMLSGEPGIGKTFLTNILTLMLPEAAHLKIVLAAEAVGKLDAMTLANTLLRAAGAETLPEERPREGTAAEWRLRLMEKVVARLRQARGTRLVWIVLRDLKKGSVTGLDAPELLTLLYEWAAVDGWLRIVLDDTAKVMPQALDRLTEVYRARSIGIDDIKAYLRRLVSESDLEVSETGIRALARLLFETYERAQHRDDRNAMADLAGETLRTADALLEAAGAESDTVAHMPLVDRFVSRLEARLPSLARDHRAAEVALDLADAKPVLDAPARPAPASLASVTTDRQQSDGPILPSETEILSAYNEAEEVAAVSGRFDPEALFASALHPAVRRAALTRLLPSLAPDDGPGRRRFLLLQDRRLPVLERLRAQERLASVLAKPLPLTDAFGDKLRDLLRGDKPPPMETLTDAALLTFAEVATACAGLKLEHLPRPDVVRIALARRAMLQDLEVMVDRDMTGRAAELRRLRRFAGSSSGASRTRLPVERPTWNGFMLRGVCGSGKSALLARFVLDLVPAQQPTAAILDFDRPGIDPADESWLECEIARQAAVQHPCLSAELQELRNAVRGERRPGADRPVADLNGFERRKRAPMVKLGVLLADDAASRNQVPALLLVLDSFGHVVARKLMSRVMYWLDELAASLFPVRLSVVIAGQIDAETEAALAPRFRSRMTMGPLRPADAARLLGRLGIRPALAGWLSSSPVVPRMPLELRLLARVIADFIGQDGGHDSRGRPGGTPSATASNLEQEICAIEAELRAGGPGMDDRFGAVLYRRQLGRAGLPAGDAVSAAVALRFLTPQLVIEIVLPAAVLQPIDIATARAVVDRLAGQTWLVRRDTDGAVWHHRHLRRSTLARMSDAERAVARRAHRLAQTFFTEQAAQPNQATGAHAAFASEAIYHSLMLDEEPESGSALRLAELRQSSASIGLDKLDLPPPGAALLRMAVTGTVPAEDLAKLPVRHAASAMNQLGQNLTADRAFGPALTLLRAQAITENPLAATAPPADAWAPKVLFATASWDQFCALPSADAPGRLPSPLSLSALHAAAIAGCLDPGDGGQAGEALQKALQLSPSESQVNAAKLATILVAFYKELPLRAPGLLHNALLALIDRLGGETDRRLPAGWLIALARVAGRPGLLRTSLSAFDLRLNPEALAAFAAQPPLSEGNEAAGRLADTLRDIVLAECASGNTTVRRLLLGIAGSAVANCPVPVGVALTDAEMPAVRTALLCLDTAFCDPARFALIDAFPGRAGLVDLAKCIASVVRLDLPDLAPHAFAAAVGSDPEEGLRPYLELVDRCWSLGLLLEAAAKRRPDAARLQRVAARLQAWHHSLDTALGTHV